MYREVWQGYNHKKSCLIASPLLAQIAKNISVLFGVMTQ